MNESDESRLIDRINAIVDSFDNLDHDETGDAWARAGSAVGELAGIAAGTLRLAAELRRQLDRADARIQLLEVREINNVDDLMKRAKDAILP